MIDLHIHTNKSDGVLSPKEVIDEAVKNGVEVIAISDHDTIEAYDDEIYAYAISKKIKLINAVEISTTVDKVNIHILGYNFDINNEELKQKLALLRRARHDYLYKVAVKLNELGYILNVEELDKIEAVTKSHIANDIVTNLQNEEKLLKDFKYIPKRGEFIETIMNKGCPAYVKKETMTPKEAVELIKRAGGKAILAHPVAYKNEGKMNENQIINLIKESKVDGIEANYIYIDRNNNRINEIERWSKVAKEANLITTVGSDFHKRDGSHPEIGLKNEEIRLSEDDIKDIINYLCGIE